MAETEGTIKFAYDLQAPETPMLDDAAIGPLRAWRTVLRRLGMLGQEKARYDGYGFGNMSVRDPEAPDEFADLAPAV